jgi:hypothetical protein
MANWGTLNDLMSVSGLLTSRLLVAPGMMEGLEGVLGMPMSGVNKKKLKVNQQIRLRVPSATPVSIFLLTDACSALALEGNPFMSAQTS